MHIFVIAEFVPVSKSGVVDMLIHAEDIVQKIIVAVFLFFSLRCLT